MSRVFYLLAWNLSWTEIKMTAESTPAFHVGVHFGAAGPRLCVKLVKMCDSWGYWKSH